MLTTTGGIPLLRMFATKAGSQILFSAQRHAFIQYGARITGSTEPSDDAFKLLMKPYGKSNSLVSEAKLDETTTCKNHLQVRAEGERTAYRM